MLFSLPLLADPFGTDADLAFPKPRRCCHRPRQSAPLVRFSEFMIVKVHKGVISPSDGPRSHFKPSSSLYTLGAIQKYGFLWGFLFGCDRLMRENNDPWIYRTVPGEYGCLFKSNPVP